MKPQFKRILVSKEKSNLKKESWETLTFEEELTERVFILQSLGDDCNESLKNLLNKKVILSDTKGIKVKEENNIEYFILPQEVILCEAPE